MPLLLSFPSVSDAPIRIAGKSIDHVFESPAEILDSIRNYYMNETLKQIYKIIGSLDFVGNPTMLINSFASGVRDFFYLPSMAFLRTPMDPSRVGIGMAKGTLSLVSNSFSGLFGFIAKVSASAGQASAVLSLDPVFQRRHRKLFSRKQRTLIESGREAEYGPGWLRSLDGSKVTCPGVREAQDECYIFDFDLSLLNLSEEEEEKMRSGLGAGGTVYGKFKRGNYPEFPNIHDFRVKRAWPLKPTKYAVRQDFRECSSPQCGGYWLRAIDGSKMKCPGEKEERDECYIFNFDFSSLNLSKEEEEKMRNWLRQGGTVYGEFKPGNYPEFPNIHDFCVKHAWPPKPTIYFVKQDLRKCASPMCGGYWLRAIDGSKMKCPGEKEERDECYIFAFDFSSLNLSKEEEEEKMRNWLRQGGTVYGEFKPGNYGWLEGYI